MSWFRSLLGNIPVRRILNVMITVMGVFEAGLLPGILVQMTMWYRPDELSGEFVSGLSITSWHNTKTCQYFSPDGSDFHAGVIFRNHLCFDGLWIGLH